MTIHSRPSHMFTTGVETNTTTTNTVIPAMQHATNSIVARDFECSVCCTEFKAPNTRRKRNRSLSCARCAYTVCYTCQQLYAKPTCMNCYFEFSKSHILSSLGDDFYKTVIIPHTINELMINQKSLLGSVDVDAEKAYRASLAAYKNGSRFSTVRTLPPQRPACNKTIVSTRYMCPVGDCRGIVCNNACNVCKTKCCVLCRSPCKPDCEHVCDPDAQIAVKTSRPCPKCCTLIHREEGCDAMRCTSCGVRFDWNTMLVTRMNSNQHYKDSALINNQLAPNNTSTQLLSEGNDICVFSIVLDRIQRDVIDRCLRDSVSKGHPECPNILIEYLYRVTRAVRTIKHAHFNEPTIAGNMHDTYHDLRVQYLLSDITESVWSNKVYKCHTQSQSCMFHADILNIFLSTTDGMQSELKHMIIQGVDSEQYASMSERIVRLVELCNTSLEEIHADYPFGSSTHPLRIRSITEWFNHDIVDCGFATQFHTNDARVSKVADKKQKLHKVCVHENPKQIVLYAYQTGHVANMMGILDKSHYVMDLSMLGAGKTFTSMCTYLNRGFKRGIVISPASMTGKWRKLCAEYGLPGVEVYSFNELAGSRDNNAHASHLITRTSITGGPNRTATARYQTTALFDQYVSEGVCVIIDEFQHIKNAHTAQTNACKSLICCIAQEFNNNSECASRAILISGSPVDRVEHIVQFYKTVGIMKHEKLTRFDIGAYSSSGSLQSVLLGLQEIRTHCLGINSTVAQPIFDARNESPMNAGNTETRHAECRGLFTRVILPYRSCSMTVTECGYAVHKYNGYFFKYGQNMASLHDHAIMKFGNAYNTMRAYLAVSHGPADRERRLLELLASIQRAMNQIETSKIPLFIRLVRKALFEHPTCKIVVACNFTRTIRDLRRELADLSPIILTGSVLKERRHKMIDLFQQPDLTHRLLIGNLRVISSGIDLDDRNGNYPRICYISPNYSTIDMYQMGHRFVRGLETKSNSTIHMVYYCSGDAMQEHVDATCSERKLLAALSKKGEIMKSVAAANAHSSSAASVFLCDYGTFLEVPASLPEQSELEAESNAIYDRCVHSTGDIDNDAIVVHIDDGDGHT